MSESVGTLAREVSSAGCGQDSEAARRGIGAVVIGRNEGERLIRCLRSLIGRVGQIVYVDSGSTDGSATAACVLGVDVVELDKSVPFTMARGRNAGFDRLMQLRPNTRLVQFVDGDCEVVDGWLARAADALAARPEVAAVCGIRRERFPEASIYNRLCDIEWNSSPGDVQYLGGDAMIRVEAFQQIGGYDASMIAGEDPELSVRLRQRGWKIQRLETGMTLHDAAMTRFGQWWRRSVRGGHAYAQGAAMHGRAPERHCVRQCRRIVLWALLMPLPAIALAWPTSGWSLLLLMVYPLQIVRIARRRRAGGDPPGLAWTYAAFCLLAKWPELIGLFRYRADRLLARESRLIEYKDVTPRSSQAEPTGPS